MRLSALLLLAYVAAAAAGETHTQMMVGATVLPVARIEGLSAPQAFSVSAADRRRGYVVVNQPITMSVFSNSRSGFALDVHNLASELRNVQVSGMGEDVSFSGDGSSISQRWDHPQKVSLELHVRFDLPENLPIGTYPWPLQMQVRPLESD